MVLVQVPAAFPASIGSPKGKAPAVFAGASQFMLGVGYIADYTAKANLIMKVLDFIKFGGLDLTVGSIVFGLEVVL